VRPVEPVVSGALWSPDIRIINLALTERGEVVSRYSVLSTQYSVLSTRYSVLGTG
jgi:hypothetical protein